jgi:hypothetical protein
MNFNVKRSMLFVVASLLLLSGCGAKYIFNKAKGLEDKGYFVQAIFEYEKVASKYPKDLLSAQAFYNIGVIYERRLKMVSQAVNYYKKVIEGYPESGPIVEKAKLSILNSPDYFPLTDGSFWMEGDSETDGKNMRAEWRCARGTEGRYSIERHIYAGKQSVTDIKKYYLKNDLKIKEFNDLEKADYTTILDYPYFPGKKWSSFRDGKTVLFTVVGVDLAIKVGAGTFTNCIKVSEEDPRTPDSIKFNYYAPGTGWILTTIALKNGSEHRNTELLTYKILPEN